MGQESRRGFLKYATFSATGLLTNDLWTGWSVANIPKISELTNLSSSLLQTWGKAVLDYQITDSNDNKNYGGLMCPACKVVHGRVCDTFYPMLYLADTNKDERWLNASLLLYEWMEHNTSQPDGSWTNEPAPGSWKGITVFTCIALAETLQKHRKLLKTSFIERVRQRLTKAGNYIEANFNTEYGNINYPVAGAYALTLLGKELNNEQFNIKGKELAASVRGFFTAKDQLIFGEGKPYNVASKKGCFSVDLGYNVEESLPSLVMYGLLNDDKELLQKVSTSMQAHMEFMLPDGAWDNSWGTRNFKWTYWGSRTSDGSLGAYGLMSNYDPRFYTAALKNTMLLKNCTHDGLLHGGPHYKSHGVTPCIHHTFCHMKSLAVYLDHSSDHINTVTTPAMLPREKQTGTRFFRDIQTWLIARGGFRATVTAYDREYNFTNGHATGGAMTMLWHALTGPVLCASMNEYQLKEANNMQVDSDPYSIPLTPRIELKLDGKTYMNISDLSADVQVNEGDQTTTVVTRSKLVDGLQKGPTRGDIACVVTYTFKENVVSLRFKHDSIIYGGDIRVIVPVICPGGEKMVKVSEKMITVS
ncbi:MAG TPA: hypothetical protein VK616_19600, partial [Flavitalea sp.]|nr:hypothetical protein [Flavitalea sp.]